MDTYWAAFMIGVVGSFHCVGMCGPIVIAVSNTSRDKLGLVVDNFLYNIGRVITYALMGMILGTLGATVKLAGYQEIVSIIVGAGMLIVLFFPKKWISKFEETPAMNSILSGFKRLFGRFMNWRSRFSFLVIGLLNGLLPCGLVYVALAASITAGGVVEGAFYMAAFGLGTVPMLFAMFTMKSFVPLKLRRAVNKFIPVGIAVVAVLLILRGLSLGIPYISPPAEKLQVNPGAEQGCCSQ